MVFGKDYHPASTEAAGRFRIVGFVKKRHFSEIGISKKYVKMMQIAY